MKSSYSRCTRTERSLGRWKCTVVGSGITSNLHPTAANAWVIKLRFPCQKMWNIQSHASTADHIQQNKVYTTASTNYVNDRVIIGSYWDDILQLKQSLFQHFQTKKLGKDWDTSEASTWPNLEHKTCIRHTRGNRDGNIWPLALIKSKFRAPAGVEKPLIDPD